MTTHKDEHRMQQENSGPDSRGAITNQSLHEPDFPLG